MIRKTFSGFLLMFLSVPAALPNTISLTPLESVIQKIEWRRGSWTALHADLRLHFSSQSNQAASCRGELTYHRLDEKMMLRCYNAYNELLFAFRTDDRHFQLYLPSRKTVFSGNIFALADSPDIDSHIKPLDLYRALKPMMLPLNRSVADSWDQEVITVNVFERFRQNNYLARSVVASHQGDVLKEVYYSPAADPLVTIYRMKFEAFKLQDGSRKDPIFYPQAIRIDSNPSQKSTLLAFDGIRFFAWLENADWSMTVPESTEMVDIEKKDMPENVNAAPAASHNEELLTPSPVTGNPQE